MITPRRISHLCITYNHLLMSLATITHLEYDVHTVYMPIDYQYVCPDIRRKIKLNFKNVDFKFVKERCYIDSFSKLPTFIPSIVRRNVSFSGFRVISSFHWFSGANKFDLFYCYHTGPFLSKCLSGNSRYTILRTDGFANYKYQDVTFFKGIIRFFFGLSHNRQIWGEEKWVNLIETPHPQLIPSQVIQEKTKKFDLNQVKTLLEGDDLQCKIIDCFNIGSKIPIDLRSSVILLTQPISEVGFCDVEVEKSIYDSIIKFFIRHGYCVYVKQHPKENKKEFSPAVSLSRDFPVEILSLLGIKARIAIALNTAALQDEFPIANRQIQLIPLELFDNKGFSQWQSVINEKLMNLSEELCDESPQVVSPPEGY